MYYARVIESQSTDPKIFDLDSSDLAGATKEARALLGGCHRGSGYVQLFDVNPRTEQADPIKVLEA